MRFSDMATTSKYAAEGFGSCPAVDSSSDISIQLQATYEATMPALYFGADPLTN